MTNDNFEVAMTKCFLCGGHKDLLMNSKLTPAMAKHVKSMHNQCTDMEPCQECKKHMETHVILIGIDEEKSDQSEGAAGAWRTGEFLVVSDRLVAQIIKEPMLADVLKRRVAFIPSEIAKELNADFERFKEENPGLYSADGTNSNPSPEGGD